MLRQDDLQRIAELVEKARDMDELKSALRYLLLCHLEELRNHENNIHLSLRGGNA